MPLVDPFTIPASLVGSNLYSAYWLATLAGLQYGAAAEDCRAFILAGGALEVIRVPVLGSPLLPAADIGIWPGDRALVMLRGTAIWQQMAAQIFGAQLVTRAPWPGRVGSTHSALAIIANAIVADWLDTFAVTQSALAGHSLGGAIAQLLVVPFVTAGRSVSAVWTFGGPRCGDPVYAGAMAPGTCLRWTNAGDPVPNLPPARDPLLDSLYWFSPAPQITGFMHWGRRAHLFPDGQILQPAGDPPQLGAALRAAAELASAGAAQFAPHMPEEYAARLRVALGPLADVGPEVAQLDQVWDDLAGDGTIEAWFNPRSCGRE